MALAVDPGVFRGTVLCGMARPANASLTAWEFAEKVVAYSLDRGRPVALFLDGATVRMALHGTSNYTTALNSPALIGVYDADCLVRDLTTDLKEFFAY